MILPPLVCFFLCSFKFKVYLLFPNSSKRGLHLGMHSSNFLIIEKRNFTVYIFPV